MSGTITFCATGKSGLGHLRRVTNVAAALSARSPARRLRLLTNAARGGLTDAEAALYESVITVEREGMARELAAAVPSLAVVDTAVLPGLEALDAPLCLILRETVAERLHRFRLPGGRCWDLVVLPNPPGHWLPPSDALPARRREAVGWIYRRPKTAEATCAGAAQAPSLLIASGGGGNARTTAQLRATLDELIARVRARTAPGLEVVQVLGPRAPASSRVAGVDRTLHPGPTLHELFPRFDLVVTTAGYNSVLELACTDVPTLLLAVERTYDDQDKRTREWGARLGRAHDPARLEATVAWMCDVLGRRARRPRVDLGPSGAAACARLLEELAS